MENLGDILRRLPQRRALESTSVNGDASQAPEDREPLCPVCNGSGWVAHRVPLGHPDHGEVFPCRCQETVSQENRLSQLLRYSNVGPLQRISFETTRPEGRLPGPQSKVLFGEAFKAAARFAEEPRGWLVLTGPSGSGKTHLAAAIANRCIERGRTVLFAFVPDLLDHLRGTYTPQSDVSYDDLSQQVRTAPVLVLDDLGKQRSSSWADEKLHQIIVHRHNNRLPTVITTMIDASQPEEGPIGSRIQDPSVGELIRMDAPDYRKSKKRRPRAQGRSPARGQAGR